MEWKKASEKFIFINYDTNSKGYKLYTSNNGKTVISREVTFNKEREWDFGLHAGDLHFFPQFEEDNEQTIMEQAREDQQESTTLPASPTSTNHGNLPASASSSGSLNETEVPHTRSLQDLYEVAERLDNPTFFCLFADSIGVKWVYKTKKNANGEVERHKARLVAKCYSQTARIDYNEQPSGYEIKGHEDKVLKLKKVLYGLK
ncbi:hypothetical protein TB1_044522 [Malus domestica]